MLGAVTVVSCLLGLITCYGNETNATEPYCVNIGGQRYCGVTKEWTSRITLTEGRIVCWVPTTYAVLMLFVAIRIFCRKNKIGYCQMIKETIARNTMLIFFKKMPGMIMYNHICRKIVNPDPYLDYKVRYIYRCKSCWGCCECLPWLIYTEEDEIQQRIHSDNEFLYLNEEKICENKTGKEDIDILVSAREVYGANDADSGFTKRRWWNRYQPTKSLCIIGCASMIWSYIASPLFKMSWDIVDVFKDCYYFYMVETGHYISKDITRNTDAINAILAFGIIGAFKSTIYAYEHMNIIKQSFNAQKYHFDTLMTIHIVVCFKILVEDGPETLLEYFYVDKFVTELRGEYWILIVRDVVSAIIHIKPLYELVIRGKGQVQHVFITNKAEYGKPLARYIHISSVIARVAFSITYVAKIVGMIYQYTNKNIAKQCLEITTAGELLQTPFKSGCMNAVDWIVLIGLFTVILVCFLVLPVCFGYVIVYVGCENLLRLRHGHAPDPTSVQYDKVKSNEDIDTDDIERPSISESQAVTRSDQRQTRNSDSPLPDSWEQRYDPDNKVFYFNTTSGTTSWTKPVESEHTETNETETNENPAPPGTPAKKSKPAENITT